MRKQERRHLRRLSAAERNVRRAASELAPFEKDYKKAHAEYAKAVQKRYFYKWQGENARTNALAKLEAAEKARKKPLYEFTVSDLVYDKFAKEYQDFVRDVEKRHPDLAVSEIRKKDIKLGGDLVKEMYRTGLTVANVPVIGRVYTRLATSDADRTVRTEMAKRRLGG